MSKFKDKFTRLAEKIKSVRHIEIIVAVLAVTIMLLIYFATSCTPAEKTSIDGTSGEYTYGAAAVAELEKKLSEIEGVGDVSVLVNWSSDSVSSGESAAAGYGKPEGVIIICDGGNNLSVKLKLISSVAAYFGISENKINVLAKG